MTELNSAAIRNVPRQVASTAVSSDFLLGIPQTSSVARTIPSYSDDPYETRGQSLVRLFRKTAASDCAAVMINGCLKITPIGVSAEFSVGAEWLRPLIADRISSPPVELFHAWTTWLLEQNKGIFRRARRSNSRRKIRSSRSPHSQSVSRPVARS
jgi:hypothetical protein